MESATSKQPTGTIVLTVSGMTCGGCASAVRRALSGVRGVSTASVDLAGERATVTGTASIDDLLRALEAAGFAAESSRT